MRHHLAISAGQRRPSDRHRSTAGTWRLFRGAVVGTFAAAFATWAHLLAGGAPPQAAALVAMSATALVSCVLASRWSWRLPGLVAVMLLAQAGFHVWFTEYDAASPGSSGHAGHEIGQAGLLDLTLPDAGMLVLHAVAALLLAGALRYGEAVLGALLDVVGLRLARVLRHGLVAAPDMDQGLGVTALAARPLDAPARLRWARGPPQ